MKKWRLVVRVDTHEVLVIRRGPLGMRCAQCAERVDLVTVDQAAAAAGVSSRAIYRRVESGALHFAETPDGQLLICLNSLLGGRP